jgi:hypothetical protein
VAGALTRGAPGDAAGIPSYRNAAAGVMGPAGGMAPVGMPPARMAPPPGSLAMAPRPGMPSQAGDASGGLPSPSRMAPPTGPAPDGQGFAPYMHQRGQPPMRGYSAPLPQKVRRSAAHIGLRRLRVENASIVLYGVSGVYPPPPPPQACVPWCSTAVASPAMDTSSSCRWPRL